MPEADEGPFLTEERGLLRSVSAMLCSYLDRERAQAEANESRMLVESAFSGLSEGVLLIDSATGKILSCNESAGRMFGYTTDELIGELTLELFEDKQSLDRFYDLYAPTLRREGRFKSEYSFRRRDGSLIHAEITMILLNDAAGERPGIVGVLRDITEERALQTSISRYRYIVSASRDPMYFVDDTYTYLVANQAAAEWHARPSEKIVGRTVMEMHGAEKFEDVVKPMLDRCLGGEAVEYQAVLKYRGRGRCEAAIRYDPCRDDSGRVIGVAVSVRDVSQYQNSEESGTDKERVVIPLNAPRR
jgi:PAS domain S-box-containing protein